MVTWPFSDPPNVAVFTSKKILDDNDCIQTVTHDEDDGAWQFHPFGGTVESDAKVVSLKTITQIDPSILELADLPLGWCAWRSTKEGQWKRNQMPDDRGQNMKVTYPADRRVSVWVGNFATEDDFDEAVDTDVSQRLALPTHIADVCEVGFEQETVPIRQLIDGFSGSETFVDVAEASAITLAISSANAALVCYYVQCEDAPERWGAFHFLGTFVGQDVT